MLPLQSRARPRVLIASRASLCLRQQVAVSLLPVASLLRLRLLSAESSAALHQARAKIGTRQRCQAIGEAMPRALAAGGAI